MQFSYDGVASAQRRLRWGGGSMRPRNGKGDQEIDTQKTSCWRGTPNDCTKPCGAGRGGLFCQMRPSRVACGPSTSARPSVPLPQTQKKSHHTAFSVQGFFAHSFRAFPHCQAREDAASWGTTLSGVIVAQDGFPCPHALVSYPRPSLMLYQCRWHSVLEYVLRGGTQGSNDSLPRRPEYLGRCRGVDGEPKG